MIGLAGLVVLGVAGYFAYKYFWNKPEQELALPVNENEKHHLTNVFSKAKEYGTREQETI